MLIGERIRQLRKERGISPEKLGDKSDISGAYIRKLEAGQNSSITLETARKLAKGLGIPVSDLIDKEESEVIYSKPVKKILKELEEAYANLEFEQIPFKGSVPAGDPCEIESFPEEFIEVPRGVIAGLNKDDLYALKISGTSLMGDGLAEDDVVLVNIKERDIIDGKLYIIETPDGCTAKHVYKNNGHLRLSGSNDTFQDIKCTDCKIIGRVIVGLKSPIKF